MDQFEFDPSSTDLIRAKRTHLIQDVISKWKVHPDKAELSIVKVNHPIRQNQSYSWFDQSWPPDLCFVYNQFDSTWINHDLINAECNQSKFCLFRSMIESSPTNHFTDTADSILSTRSTLCNRIRATHFGFGSTSSCKRVHFDKPRSTSCFSMQQLTSVWQQTFPQKHLRSFKTPTHQPSCKTALQLLEKCANFSSSELTQLHLVPRNFANVDAFHGNFLL